VSNGAHFDLACDNEINLETSNLYIFSNRVPIMRHWLTMSKIDEWIKAVLWK